ncbi:DUF732 domain-containing protein [Mycobacterium sp.]|uniref:DUF732 domain-containing protein n=1 Tax=Mycobacterium sp. TaxID=1785 RepID=UPI0012755A85|nr:DUF732 domain-containing protein [Mycobacterium sp.]KAA8965842.1 MAG: DUF732 domain-containing protein [Mycobacterium sp.]
MISATSNPMPWPAQFGPGLKPATTANKPDAAPEQRSQRPRLGGAGRSCVRRVTLTGALFGVTAAAVIAATAFGSAANADPNQDQQFLALLEEEDIGAIDGVPELIARAHDICHELDGGASVPAIAQQEANIAYDDNPRLRLVPARVHTTVLRFITASVDVYCPYEQDKLP